MTEKTSHIFTEKRTEQNIDKLTSPISLEISELLTQKIINLETHKNTEKLSEELIDKNKCLKEDILLNKCKEQLIDEEQINKVYVRKN